MTDAEAEQYSMPLVKHWLSTTCQLGCISEGNALFSRYENDPNSKIIDHLDDSEHDRDYAVIETTLYTVISKGVVMDLKFLSSIKDGDEWESELLH